MSDFNSSLPTRTQSNGDVVVFIADGTTPSQVNSVDTHGSLSSIIKDVSGNAVTTQSNGGQRSLDTRDQANGPVTPGTVANFSELIGGQYNTSLPTPINGQQVAIQVDANGRLWANVTNLPTIVDTNFGAVGSSTIRVAAEVGNASGINSATNPVFVTLSDTIGTSIDNYQTSAALASNASVNLDYTVTAAKTFYSKQVWASGSGKIKIVVEFETSAGSGTFNTFWVGFNSTAETNILIPIPTSKTQVAGAKIRLIITNLDKAAQDVYSTLSGTEQ